MILRARPDVWDAGSGARRWVALILLLLLTGGVMADDPFGVDFSMVGPNHLAVIWRVAPGHHLYREQMKLELRLGERPWSVATASWPAVVMKSEPGLGDQPMYPPGEYRLNVVLPPVSGGAGSLTVRFRYQGCADEGVCFPPETMTVSFAAIGEGWQKMPSASASGASPAAGAVTAAADPSGGWLTGGGSGGEGVATDGARDLSRGGSERFGAGTGAGGEPGTVAASGTVARTGVGQGSAATTASARGVIAAGQGNVGSAAGEIPGSTGDPQSALAGRLATGSPVATLLSFFGFGLLLAFTPCVFPMIPILSGIIAGQGQSVSTGRAFGLSLAYVLAMAVAYTVAGVIAGLLGENIQAALQNPWALGLMAGLLVALAMSMFGFYDLALPAPIQNRLGGWSRSQGGGTWMGAAAMGFLSALMVGPCVAPPLAGALIYIGRTGDALLGGAALFSLSLGMGTPLLLIGTTAGKLLPRAGAWMEQVKAAFGLIMIGVALDLLARVLPGFWVMLGWAALAMATGQWLRDFVPAAGEIGPGARLARVGSWLAVIWSAVTLIGAAAGGESPSRPLAVLVAPRVGIPVGEEAPTFVTVRDLAGLEREQEKAVAAGKPLLVDVWASWCTACHELEVVTFADSSVRARLRDWALVKFDASANDEAVKEAFRRHGVVGPPTLIFFDRQGRELGDRRRVGFIPSGEMAALLRIE